LSAAVKAAFRGCSDVRAVTTGGGGASVTAGGARVVVWVNSVSLLELLAVLPPSAVAEGGRYFEGLKVLRVNQDMS
jgi:hypothetical protein